MNVICNCNGMGCLQCRSDRAAAAGGEQGSSPLELEVEGWRAASDGWHRRAIAAERSCDEWKFAAQYVADLFDPLASVVTPASLRVISLAAKCANASLRDERDTALAELAILRPRVGVA